MKFIWLYCPFRAQFCSVGISIPMTLPWAIINRAFGAHCIKIEQPIYEILQILAKSLPDKTPINQLLNKSDYQNVKERDCMLLLFN